MSDSEKRTPETPEEEPKAPIVYASPVKRIWAWVGIAYMLVIVLLFTWYMAKATFLYGLGPLMMIPALGGLLATVVQRYESGQGKGGPVVCILFVVLCAALIILNLVIGIPSLLANFGG